MNIDFSNFQGVFDWVIANGYIFIFLAMCIEGPVTTAAAGFASALGYFDPFIILIISILGDLVPDSIYYYIGYFGQGPVVEKAVRYFGLTKKRVLRIKELSKEHFGKTMVVLKLTPVVPTLGFILVGYLKLSFIKFTKYSALVTIPKSILFLVLGYFFGRLYNISKYLHYIEIFIPVIIIILVIIFVLYKKMSVTIAEKIEKI